MKMMRREGTKGDGANGPTEFMTGDDALVKVNRIVPLPAPFIRVSISGRQWAFSGVWVGLPRKTPHVAGPFDSTDLCDLIERTHSVAYQAWDHDLFSFNHIVSLFIKVCCIFTTFFTWPDNGVHVRAAGIKML
jgi:hypothetical protein